MTEYSRRDERIKTMQAFYQVFLFIENKQEYDATQILCDIYGVEDYSECPAFSQAVYALGLDHYDEIKNLISKHLVGWVFERLDNACKAILFVSLTEGLYVQKAPRKVVINEGVILSKNYLKTDDHKFVNALLDKAIPSYEYDGK